MIDETSRKILNNRLDEASANFNKTIEDHLKYQKGLIKEIVQLRSLNSTYLKMIKMSEDDIDKILISFDEKSKVKSSEEGKKFETAFKREVQKIQNQ